MIAGLCRSHHAVEVRQQDLDRRLRRVERHSLPAGSFTPSPVRDDTTPAPTMYDRGYVPPSFEETMRSYDDYDYFGQYYGSSCSAAQQYGGAFYGQPPSQYGPSSSQGGGGDMSSQFQQPPPQQSGPPPQFTAPQMSDAPQQTEEPARPSSIEQFGHDLFAPPQFQQPPDGE